MSLLCSLTNFARLNSNSFSWLRGLALAALLLCLPHFAEAAGEHGNCMDWYVCGTYEDCKCDTCIQIVSPTYTQEIVYHATKRYDTIDGKKVFRDVYCVSGLSERCPCPDGVTEGNCADDDPKNESECLARNLQEYCVNLTCRCPTCGNNAPGYQMKPCNTPCVTPCPTNTPQTPPMSNMDVRISR